VKFLSLGKDRNIFVKLLTTKERFGIFSKSKETKLSIQPSSMSKFSNTVEEALKP